MDRRKFLRNGSVTGLAIAAMPLLGLGETVPQQADTKFKIAGEPDDFTLNEVTIDQLQQKMSSGEYSSVSITKMYLQRITDIDKKGPKLNAIIELNPEALSMASAMDKERKENGMRGPLHGIPVLIKDNIDSGDQMMTTAGALALKGNKARKDAFIVAQLRAAGAVLLGKTNLSEWANFRSTRATSGWSSRGGQTKNPYILERNPSGSSSGSGAAVAANLCVAAIGTETDGSIVSPASVNGVVGIKPTVGLLSRSGIIPISATQDTAGPMARTVKDAAILLSALSAADPDDAAARIRKEKDKKDYSSSLSTQALRGKKIGIEKSFLKGNETVVALYQQAIDILKTQGAVVVETDLMKDIGGIGDAELTVLKYEFKDGVNRYLAKADAHVKTLADVIVFNKKNEADAMPFFKEEILESCAEKGELSSREYTDALAKTLSSRKMIDDLIASLGLDAICAVTNGPAWCTDIVNGDYDTGFSFSSPAAMAGYPHITVPMGLVHELPIGFSFMAGAYREAEIIQLAYAFEQASRKRVPPKFISSSLTEWLNG